jgi:hypothetical protein
MRCLALFCAFSFTSLAASPSTHTLPVTVVLDFEHDRNDVSLPTVRSELQKLLSDAHVQVELRLRSQLAGRSQFGEIVIFKMKGVCSVASGVPIGALSDERGPLAMTYTTDGEILPFGEVECDRVRQSLSRVWKSDLTGQHSHQFGVAIARVMAHELYHMLGESPAHTKAGVTKEGLSAHELMAPDLNFPKAASDAVGNRAGLE